MKAMILVLLAVFPVVVCANPSISTDANRSTDAGQSTSVKKDKSLSADKSRGNRETESDSRERAREVSRSRSHQERSGDAWETSNSYSVDVNINGLLLREFAARYERTNQGAGTAWDYFHTCKPLTNALVDYPVRDYTHGGVTGRLEAMRPDSSGMTRVRGDGLTQSYTDPSDRYISRYAQCRMTASYWIATAGDRASAIQVTTESEMRERIRDTFEVMDADEGLFQIVRQRARDIWQQASCSNWLDDYNHFKSPEIECGIFSYVGSTFTVEYRQTLSESSIDGRSYKVAMNSQESQSLSIDDSTSREGRTSYAERDSDTRERFKESKKTATLSKSKTLDRNNSSKMDRGAGSSMNASPKE